MTGLPGLVVDAAIGWLVETILGSYFTEQIEAWTREIGLAEDVEKLKFEMRNVEMVLAAAEGRRIENKPLARSLDFLKELLYDSEDVMDELDYYRLQQQIEEGKGCSAPSGVNPEGSYVSSSAPSSAFELVCSATSGMTSWASSSRKRKREEEGPVQSTMLTYEIKHDISQRINGIVKGLCTIGNSVQRVLQLEVSRPTSTSLESQNISNNGRLTTSVPVVKMYGRESERDNIIELLIEGGSSDLNVLPVVGIGGVGKTTLARFVCKDQRIRDHFDLQMWVCVSTDFNEVRLTREILEHVCENRQEYEDISNFNVLQKNLLKNIRNKRFLLVLDDMWEDKDRSGWIKFLAPLKGNQASGCMILAATRMDSVAKMIQTMDKVRLSGLNEEEFWLLFKACAFGNENYEGDPGLQSIGKQIVKALKGCPLAAQSVGALLNTSVSDKHWRAVRDKWRSLQEDANDILPVLKLSYDYLPVHLQHCFSYCSLYPEDKHFDGKELVHAWVSQNFVQCEDPTMKLEETGQQYLERLVDLCFFQKAGSRYVMHDLMHELAGKVSSNECATIHGLKHEAIRPSVRHLSVITTAFDKDKPDSFPNEKFDKILEKVGPSQKLRTLMFFGRSSINLLESLRTLCKKANCLRVLRIYVTYADMSSIHSLFNPYHLRYLEYIPVDITDRSSYRVYNNTVFPQALTRFYHLQVWNDNSTSLQTEAAKDVLEGLQPHQDLKTLKITGYGGLTSPTWLSNTSSVTLLQILHLEKCREWNFFPAPAMLPFLRKLTLIRMLNLTEISVPSLEELILIDMPKLDKCIGSYGMELTFRLRVLMIKNCPQLNECTLFQSYSSFDTEQKSWFPSLRKLSIGQCPRILNNWPILPLKEMEALKELELVDLHVIRVSVSSLEKLVLTKMPSLEFCSSLTTQGNQMEWPSSLRKLTIHDCPCLIVSPPLPPSALISEMSIRGVPGLAEMRIINRRGIIIKSNELSVLDDTTLAFNNLGGITSFQINNCPNLASVSSKAFSQLIALEILCIHDCPNLTMSNIMPEVVQENSTSASSLVFPSLKYVNISTCGVTGRWLSQLLSHSQRLEELQLTACSQIKFLSISQPTETEGTSSLASAGMISAQDEQELRLPCDLLCSLKMLCIRQSLDLKFFGGNRDSTRFTSLSQLVLFGCPKLVSSLLGETKDDGTIDVGLLPPSLEDLCISHLPENLQSFAPQGLLYLKKLNLFNGPCLTSVQLHSCTALQELQIGSCVQLAVLEGLQFLTSLRSLNIEMNPELSSAWDLNLQEQEQGGNQIPLLPPSLDKLEISALTDSVQSRLLSCLPVMTNLAIRRSPELTSLQLGCCIALKELGIEDCSSLASIEGLQFCTNLTSLRVLNSPGLVSCLELVSHQQRPSDI
ncbi:disease resistance protein RGA2-like isoform X3 [Hordeum vulgare subsp. vulgare]|uniref:disease resistance protein RGA2-like isoform X3 n=1 Tax=Hordeum vulgare subsp. vulgare TaxID=112509 RepID=UPI001D1A51A5|nr:disease resistance protein RGA2-like isoform X3 [Hordeum vulgare subsp. vulgare]